MGKLDSLHTYIAHLRTGLKEHQAGLAGFGGCGLCSSIQPLMWTGGT